MIILMTSPIVRLGFDLWWLADTRRMEIIQYTDIEIWYEYGEWVVGSDGGYIIAGARSDADDPVSAINWEAYEDEYDHAEKTHVIKKDSLNTSVLNVTIALYTQK